MNEFYCSHCGEAQTDTAAFCGNCGALQGQQCGHCNTRNEAGERFCSDCGKGLPVYCSTCRSGNEAGAEFCADCGESFTVKPINTVKRNGQIVSGIAVAAVCLVAVLIWPVGEESSSSTSASYDTANNSVSSSSSSGSSRSASASSSSSSARSCSQYVGFSFDGSGAEYSSQINLSTPSGVSVSGNGSNNVSASAYNGCVGGSYSFRYSNNATLVGTSSDAEWRTYSGSFSVPSTATSCNVTISDGFSVSVNVSCY